MGSFKNIIDSKISSISNDFSLDVTGVFDGFSTIDQIYDNINILSDKYRNSSRDDEKSLIMSNIEEYRNKLINYFNQREEVSVDRYFDMLDLEEAENENNEKSVNEYLDGIDFGVDEGSDLNIEYEKKGKNKYYKNGELYSNYIKLEGLESSNKDVLVDILNKYYLNKSFNIGGKNKILTADYINNNLTNILVIFMYIESSGGKSFIKNSKSSAKGILQWMDGYRDGVKNPKYHRGYYIGKKYIEGEFSPFEVALRRSDMFYNNGKFSNFESDKTPHYIKSAWDNGGMLDLYNFSNEKQINIWMIDLIMRGNTARANFIEALLGNKSSARFIYDKYHHTNVTGKTNTIAEKHFSNHQLKNIS